MADVTLTSQIMDKYGLIGLVVLFSGYVIKRVLDFLMVNSEAKDKTNKDLGDKFSSSRWEHKSLERTPCLCAKIDRCSSTLWQALTGWLNKTGKSIPLSSTTSTTSQSRDNKPMAASPQEDDFKRALKIVLEFEGGLANDPDDPGGLTNYGTSLRYNPELGRKGILEMTSEKAGEIYRKKYWAPAGCDALPWPLSLVVFDSAVNLGVGVALRFLVLPLQHDAQGPRKGGDQYAPDLLRPQKIRENPVKAKYRRGWENRLKEARICDCWLAVVMVYLKKSQGEL